MCQPILTISKWYSSITNKGNQAEKGINIMVNKQDSYWMECSLDEIVDQKVCEYLRGHHAEYREGQGDGSVSGLPIHNSTVNAWERQGSWLKTHWRKARGTVLVSGLLLHNSTVNALTKARGTVLCPDYLYIPQLSTPENGKVVDWKLIDEEKHEAVTSTIEMLVWRFLFNQGIDPGRGC